MIENFQETDQGDLFVANGIDIFLRWDGFLGSMQPVGMDAPATALVLGGSGFGAIVGTFFAYQRFIDEFNNPSNLSAISNTYEATGTTGTITGASNASPIVITSAGHLLTTGTTVKITGVEGNTSANNTWVITVIDNQSFRLDDSHGTDDYTGGGVWTSGVSTILYSSVPIPSEAKVRRRQILRNTDGQATTFYVDVDTTDLTGASFPSTRLDSALAAQEAVPLLDDQGDIFANRNDKPLSFFPFLGHHLGRMFAVGQIEYNIGHCKAVFGSKTVTGVGTNWKTTFAGRFLYISGAGQPYEIVSADETLQTLTLLEVYKSATSSFLFYSVRPPAAYRRVAQFTEAGLPQSWSIVNGVSIQETGDEFTGLMQKGSFIYFIERRHIHKLTFSVSPLKDGAVFMVANRGCVNNRCWIVVDDSAYMLDELGIHKFSANSQVEHLSAGVQSLFRSDDDLTEFKIQWQWKEYFHACLDRRRETIRWFVCMDGNRYPRHALCYQYGTKRWWIEEFPSPIGGSCSGEMARRQQVFYGGQHRKVYAAWVGSLDLTDPANGTVRSTVTGATAFTMSDTAAAWPATGIVNAPLAILHGTGKGQVRRIVSVSGTSVEIDRPWGVLPDATSSYQIGAIHWVYRSSWFRLAPTEYTAPRRFEMVFEPLPHEATADLRFFIDFSGQAEVQGQTQAAKDGGGIACVKGESDMTVDLTRENGLVDRQLPQGKEYFIRGKRYTQYELEGFSNLDIVKLYQLSYEGVVPNQGGSG